MGSCQAVTKAPLSASSSSSSLASAALASAGPGPRSSPGKWQQALRCTGSRPRLGRCTPEQPGMAPLGCAAGCMCAEWWAGAGVWHRPANSQQISRVSRAFARLSGSVSADVRLFSAAAVWPTRLRLRSACCRWYPLTLLCVAAGFCCMSTGPTGRQAQQGPGLCRPCSAPGGCHGTHRPQQHKQHQQQ